MADGKAWRVLQAEKGLPGQGVVSVKISQVRQLGLGRLVSKDGRIWLPT